jgi:transposase-like protein
MPKKRLGLSEAEKLQLVFSSFQSDLVVTKFCKEHGISRTSLYRWRRLVLDGLSALFTVNKRPTHGRNASHSHKQGLMRRTSHYKCRFK